MNEVKTELNIFCPRKSCPFYGKPGKKINKDGVYNTKSDHESRQMFYCYGGHHRFSETGFSELFGKHGSFKEYEQTSKLSSHGLSTAAIADVLLKDERTIASWQQAIGHKAERFHLFLCLTIQIKILFLQMDELWSYLKRKKQQLWVFISLEANTKFWLTFQLGSRSRHTANRLVAPLKKMGRWGNDIVLKVTTDKMAAYKHALETSMIGIPYIYLQIVKKRFKRRLITVKKHFVKGAKKDFGPKTQNTSFIERFNLTLRQKVSYLQRKTWGYCKSKENFASIMWINLFDYNYRHFHKSLRIKISQHQQKFRRRWLHQTPAMAAELTNLQLSWRFLIVVPIPITS